MSHLLKITEPTYQCIVVFQLQGEGPKKVWAEVRLIEGPYHMKCRSLKSAPRNIRLSHHILPLNTALPLSAPCFGCDTWPHLTVHMTVHLTVHMSVNMTVNMTAQ